MGWVFLVFTSIFLFFLHLCYHKCKNHAMLYFKSCILLSFIPKIMPDFWTLHCRKSKNHVILKKLGYIILVFTPKECSTFGFALLQDQKLRNIIIYGLHSLACTPKECLIFALALVISLVFFASLCWWGKCKGHKCFISLSATIIHTWTIHMLLHFLSIKWQGSSAHYNCLVSSCLLIVAYVIMHTINQSKFDCKTMFKAHGSWFNSCNCHSGTL
jgi:hypothetical protein